LLEPRSHRGRPVGGPQTPGGSRVIALATGDLGDVTTIDAAQSSAGERLSWLGTEDQAHMADLSSRIASAGSLHNQGFGGDLRPIPSSGSSKGDHRSSSHHFTNAASAIAVCHARLEEAERRIGSTGEAAIRPRHDADVGGPRTVTSTA
jgi:hypothetical protein